MSSFVGLYTGLSGIQAAQTGIDITSNNVANANTPGYTRQRVELAARPGYRSLVGQIGTGVDVQDIVRLRNHFLDDRFRVASGDQAQHAVRADVLATLEELSGEPEHGLSLRFGRLWSAAEAWANDPSDPATRGQVIAELSNISEGMRTTASSWNRLAEDLDARRETVVDGVNQTLTSLHDLNQRIANAEPGRIGPELFDQRDLLLDELAELTGATVRIDGDDRAIATIGGQEVLNADGAATVAVAGTQIEVTPPGGGAAVDVTATSSGELAGLHRVLVDDLPTWQAELGALATSFATAVNGVNESGYLADGATAGGPLLGYDPADPAGSIAVAPGVTADSLANATQPGSTKHDDSNARLFADLRQGAPLESELADLIVALAGEVRASRNAAQAADGIAKGARNARAAEHGVSLDEEMVGLVRYQRSLEAAARVMTTVDQALDVLVNRVGIVGR